VVAILSPAKEGQTRSYTVRGVNIHYRVGSADYTLFVDEGMTACYTDPYQRHQGCKASIPVTPGQAG
jgi:hypothetical protein